MMIRGYEIGAKLIATVVAVIALVLVVGLTVRSCDKRRSQAAQHKVERAQTGALTNSAADAVNTVGNVSTNAASSEALTRSNERSIRDAEGSSDKVNPAVRDAGFASLCKRASFRNSPTGKLRCAPAK
jgi:type II secretory pathway component PulM